MPGTKAMFAAVEKRQREIDELVRLGEKQHALYVLAQLQNDVLRWIADYAPADPADMNVDLDVVCALAAAAYDELLEPAVAVP